jgi:hypothetical protein
MKPDQFKSLRKYCRDDAAFEELQRIVSSIEACYQQSEKRLLLAQQQSQEHSRRILFQASLLNQVCNAVIATDMEGRIT